MRVSFSFSSLFPFVPCLPLLVLLGPVLLALCLPPRGACTSLRGARVPLRGAGVLAPLVVMLVLVRIRSNLRHPPSRGLFLGVGGHLGTPSSLGRPFWMGSCSLCCAGQALQGFTSFLV